MDENGFTLNFSPFNPDDIITSVDYIQSMEEGLEPGSSSGSSSGSTPAPAPIIVTRELSELVPTGVKKAIWTSWYTTGGDAGLYYLGETGNQCACSKYLTWNDSASYRHVPTGKIFWKVRILPWRNMLYDSSFKNLKYGSQQAPIYQYPGHTLKCWYLMKNNVPGAGHSQETGNYERDIANITPFINTNWERDSESPTYAYINFTDFAQKITHDGTFSHGFVFWALRDPLT